MGLTADQYREQLAALQPPGLALPADIDSNWQQLLHALAEEFARVDARADVLIQESDPRTTFELLTDWERATGLPDPCLIDAGLGLGERRAEIEAKLVAQGGQTPAYFTEVANRLGYDIEIEEIPLSISGALVAGGELSGAATDIYWWRVHVPLDVSTGFLAGNAVAGDELGYFRPAELECLFDRLKPAHTDIEYNLFALEG